MTTHDTPESTVRCSKCGRTEEVNFAACLRAGWPKCHGYTMTLTETTADVGAATAAALEFEP
jgi:phage FluMu protein Com